MSQQFRLPCSCGKFVLVRVAQAGATARCVCGATLEIPGSREIALLEPDSPAESRTSATSSSRFVARMLFAIPFAIALLAGMVGGYYGLLASGLGEGMSFETIGGIADQRIDEMSPIELLELHRSLVKEDLSRNQLPDQVVLYQLRTQLLQKTKTSCTIAGIAFAMALVAMWIGRATNSTNAT